MSGQTEREALTTEGWHEWRMPGVATTHIAYVHENGEVYDPEHGWNPVEFLLAAAEGRVHALMRRIDPDDEALVERLFAAALAATGYADTDEGRNAAITLRHDLIDRGGIAAMLAEVAK